MPWACWCILLWQGCCWDSERLSHGEKYMNYHFTTSEAERAERRALRTAARKKRRWARRRTLFLRTLPILVLAAAGIGAWLLLPGHGAALPEDEALPNGPIPPAGEPDLDPGPEPIPPWSAAAGPSTVQLAEEVGSGHAILIDVDTGRILAEKDAYTASSPASMTKIMTLLVAVEELGSLEGHATVTEEALAYCWAHECSMAGFTAGEEVPLRDLLYGTILPSGADAALTLADYVAGSHDAFVDLMNKKAVELGLSGAHFANCVGIYDPDNYCSVYDMAVILKAAMDNEVCREVLGSRTYDIPARGVREGDVTLSNWFIRRIEDHMPDGMEVSGAKTGFINDSGNCAASLARNADGKSYICVTAQGTGIWPCVYDHVALYKMSGKI